MRTGFKIVVASLAVLAASPALAQPYGPPARAEAPNAWDIHRRIDWLQQRIDRGRADGSLDRREARRLQRETDRIRQDVNRIERRHHGRLSPRDRDMLQTRLDRLARNIHWQRHDADVRPPWFR